MRDIRNGNAKFVERQSLRLTVWDVKLGDAMARVIYDSIRKQLVTFLPSETMEDEHPE